MSRILSLTLALFMSVSVHAQESVSYQQISKFFEKVEGYYVCQRHYYETSGNYHEKSTQKFWMKSEAEGAVWSHYQSMGDMGWHRESFTERNGKPYFVFESVLNGADYMEMSSVSIGESYNEKYPLFSFSVVERRPTEGNSATSYQWRVISDKKYDYIQTVFDLDTNSLIWVEISECKKSTPPKEEQE